MIRVVIVEDNREIRNALQSLLGFDGEYFCAGAYENAEEAIINIPNLSIDVALVDINLPGKSGIELIAILKKSSPNIQFIVLTVFEDNDNIFNALKAGATGYLLKSSPPAKILEAITEVHSGGSPMTSQIARKVISIFNPSTKATNENENLSKREFEILNLLAKGYRYKEIGEKLFISTETVRTHIRNIYQKLQVESAIEAINKVFGKSIH